MSNKDLVGRTNTELMTQQVDEVADTHGDMVAASLMSGVDGVTAADILNKDNSLAARLLTAEQVADGFMATPYREAWGKAKILAELINHLQNLVFRTLGLGEQELVEETASILLDDVLGLEMMVLYFWILETIKEPNEGKFAISGLSGPTGSELPGERMQVGDFAANLFTILVAGDRRLENRLDQVAESLELMAEEEGLDVQSFNEETMAMYRENMAMRIFHDIFNESEGRYEPKIVEAKFSFE